MSHHTKLTTGQYVNHNGDWSGPLDFDKPVLLVDCLDCLARYLEARMARHLGYGASGSLLSALHSDLEALGALDSTRPLLDNSRGGDPEDDT